MTEPTSTEEPGAAGTERSIAFRGREIWVKMPSPEQYLVWQRSVKQLEKLDENDWNAEQAIKALARGRAIIDSVILNNPDKEWIDDEWLEGTFGLIETAQILQLATEAFEEKNRAARRAAPKKAARRKVTK